MRLVVLVAILVLIVTLGNLHAQLSPDTDFLATSPAAQGTIRQYVIDPRGEVEGLLLTDGTHVLFTSRVQHDIIATMRPGTPIRIEGHRHRHFPLVEPDSITDTHSGATIKIPSRLEGCLPEGKESLSVQPMHAEGSIDRFLYDRSGRVSGLVFHNGTEVWLPPDVHDQVRRSLHTEDTLIVEGHGTENEYGRAIEAIAMGLQGGPLTPLDQGTRRLEESRSQP